MNKVAIIDIGTNNFHLLIAEREESKNGYKLNILHKSKVFALLGKGGISEKIIAPEAMQRALLYLKSFSEIIDSFDCKQVIAIATSAVRNATNKSELIEKTKQLTGIEIQVIDGNREAELIYYGVKSNLKINEPSLIVDIGGGSVEFIICNDQQIFWKQSFEIGAQRLLDNFQKTDPIKTENIIALNNFLAHTLAPLFKAIQNNPLNTLVGSAGSFDTIVDIYCARYQVDNTLKSRKEFDMPLTQYWKIHEELINKDFEARLKIAGMLEARAEMIVVASSLIAFIIKQLNIDKMRVSAASLKEGALWEWGANYFTL